jgi:beta-glucosidase
MIQASFHFPRGFLWGCATSSHQVEGNNTNNNWWAWEQQAGRIAQGQHSGLACDWWSGRWREDFDRAAAGGQNAHRLSIEWSRVQPAPNRWDEHAIDRYREMARGLKERGMLPMVCLHHFSDPLWLEETGGWVSEKVVKAFEAYTSKVVEALREYVSLWVTINEPNVLVVNAYLSGLWPPGKNDFGTALSVVTNQVRAHAAAYHAIHRLQPTASVGWQVHIRPMLPHRAWSPLDRLAASLAQSLFNGVYFNVSTDGVLRFPFRKKRLPEAAGTQDFLGLNYYTREYAAFSLTQGDPLFVHHFYPADADLSEDGFIANDPEGFTQALDWARGFKLPVYITENGVNDSEDKLRPRYLVQHLHQLWRAVNGNYPIQGYFHWTLVDNFEWERGWTQRYGLWELDPETQARRKRPSADLYAEICRENGVSSEVVRRYAPEALEKIFPG